VNSLFIGFYVLISRFLMFVSMWRLGYMVASVMMRL